MVVKEEEKDLQHRITQIRALNIKVEVWHLSEGRGGY